MEMANEEAISSLTFSRIAFFEIFSFLIEGSKGGAGHDLAVEFTDIAELFIDQRVENFDTKIDIGEQSITAFIADFTKSFNTEQAVRVKHLTTGFKDVEYFDLMQPLQTPMVRCIQHQ